MHEFHQNLYGKALASHIGFFIRDHSFNSCSLECNNDVVAYKITDFALHKNRAYNCFICGVLELAQAICKSKLLHSKSTK